MVPIVLSPPKVNEILPPHSFIDVFDFSSPKELAEYLLHLNSSDSEYLEYFNWKKHYTVKNKRGSMFCQFCNYLFNVRKPSVIQNFTEWFLDQSKCNNDKTLDYLPQNVAKKKRKRT